jgi:hypothetical protein
MTTAACISSMRSALARGGLAALALISASCSAHVHPITAAAPGANLVDLHTFRVLSAPQGCPGDTSRQTVDPLLTDPIMSERLRDDLVRGFEERGYVQHLSDPDVLVTYCVMEAREEPRGSVIVHVIHPGTRELLWRGEGVVNMWVGSITYGLHLDESVAAIVRRFPRRS